MGILRRVTKPTKLPVSIAEFKAHAAVMENDDDMLIAAYLASAADMVDARGVLGRAVMTQTWDYSFYSPALWVKLPLGETQSVSSISYFDEDNASQTADLSDFVVSHVEDGTMIAPVTGACWPTTYDRPDAITIRYVVGSDTPSPAIKQAIHMLVAHWLENREATTANFRALPTPMGFDDLIGTQRLSWYG